MSLAKFIVTEHWSPCQLIREYPHGAKSDDAKLFLAVKQYRPRRTLNKEAGGVTLIATHGNGFPKECYEPLWDELLEKSKVKIRAIWVADNAHQGASYARNANALGDDPGWNDHSRDLLLMVNNFRDKMKSPFVGVAHSMGCSQLANLAFIHPRLLHSIVFIEPVIRNFQAGGANMALLSSLRRENWDSRAKAEGSLIKAPLFKNMDPRALNAFFKYGLRDVENGRVSLSTPKAQESWSYVRSKFHPLPEDADTAESRARERVLTPDILPFSEASDQTFARGENIQIFESLGHLRPRVLLIYGSDSTFNSEQARKGLLGRIGTSRGGNGGAADGGAEMKVIDKGSHFVAFDRPAQTAAEMSGWLEKEMARWEKEANFWSTVDTGKSKNDQKDLSERWVEGVKKGAVSRPKTKDVPKL